MENNQNSFLNNFKNIQMLNQSELEKLLFKSLISISNYELMPINDFYSQIKDSNILKEYYLDFFNTHSYTLSLMKDLQKEVI